MQSKFFAKIKGFESVRIYADCAKIQYRFGLSEKKYSLDIILTKSRIGIEFGAIQLTLEQVHDMSLAMREAAKVSGTQNTPPLIVLDSFDTSLHKVGLIPLCAFPGMKTHHAKAVADFLDDIYKCAKTNIKDQVRAWLRK